MENVRKRTHVELVNNKEKVARTVKKPTYKRHEILTDNLVLFEMEKSIVQLNKAIYTGFVVLEVSKLLMYRFHYDVIKKRYGENARLLMTDTGG